jgi:nucleoside diphosphate kinase
MLLTKKIQQILKQLERDSLKALKYQPHGGLLFYIKRNYIRKKNYPLKPDIMKYIYNSPIVRHSGFEKTPED